MKNKSLGFCLAAIAAALGLVTLILVLIYGARGGQVSALVLVALAVAIVSEVSLLFGEKPWTYYTGIVGVALLAYALMTVISDGIWNIAESINGITMIGRPELAGMNYVIAVVNLLACLVAIVANFMKKAKEA